MELIVECGLSNDNITIPAKIWNQIPYFNALMKHDMEESINHRIKKSDTDSSTMRMIIKCFEKENFSDVDLPEVGTSALDLLKVIADQLCIESI
jgi:hypothetical protein